MDNDLKTGLWNAFYEAYVLKCNDEFHDFLKEKIWVEYFKYPRDEFVRYPEGYYNDECYDQIRNHFLDLEDDEFYEICDLMEFIVHVYPVDAVNEVFMDKCNETLKKELSVYRFVGRKITKITSETENNRNRKSIKRI